MSVDTVDDKRHQAMSIGAERIMVQADQLAQCSAERGALTRGYLTNEHRSAHDLIAKWMRDAGLETWQDSVGNQWGRKVGSDPEAKALVLGSHSDTVRNAGKYDGNLGIILAIEALSQLKECRFPFHIDVVAFADEEGMRFNTTLIGSSSVAGQFDPNWLDIADADDMTMADAMRQFGLAPSLAGNDARNDLLAYLEVHIEQGPVLEAESLPVGIVTGIAGAKRFTCKVEGMAGHAGTVPIDLRQDALCGAAEMVSFIERFAREQEIVATVGKLSVAPGAVNVIPGAVEFTLDIRSLNQPTLEACCEVVINELNLIAKKRRLHFDSDKIYQAKAVLCDAALQQQWASVVESVTGQTARCLPSGAGHDAMVMAKVTDIAMLFVRCEKGISHHPKEQVNQDDVAVALECLIGMIDSMNLKAKSP